jgi:hypothetical protein
VSKLKYFFTAYLPQITGLGIQLICSAIILVVAAEVIYFIHINPDVGYGIMGLFILVIASIVFWGLIYYSKKLLALNSFSKWKKIKPTKP